MMFACVEDDRKRHDFKYDLVNLEHGERESKQQSLFMHLRRWITLLVKEMMMMMMMTRHLCAAAQLGSTDYTP